MNLNADFLINFRQFIKYYEFCLKDINKKYNLSKIELDIISFLFNNPSKDTLSDIVEFRMLQKGNVSKAVDLLIEKDLLLKEIDIDDRRKIHLQLTENSRDITKDIEIVKRDYLKQIYRDFSDEEIKLYSSLNKRILENIQSIKEKGD